MQPSTIRPTNIVLDRTRKELRISWNDGHESMYSFEFLRANCPCAECKTTRENPDPLRFLPALDTNVESAQLVGNYALNIIWGDGHRYGIYSWELLRNWD
jgi:DUF971 family protein